MNQNKQEQKILNWADLFQSVFYIQTFYGGRNEKSGGLDSGRCIFYIFGNLYGMDSWGICFLKYRVRFCGEPWGLIKELILFGFVVQKRGLFFILIHLILIFFFFYLFIFFF